MSDIASTLPKAVATYVAAEKAKDVEMLALCFAADARVFDEDHDYRGLDAIMGWKRETNVKYNYVMEPINASIEGNSVRLSARLTGDFPGSPVDLDYTFMLESDKIVSLEIG